MRPINGKTRLIAIFGWPLSYTLSPLFQNAALRAAGVDAVYLPLAAPDAAGFLALARSLQASPHFLGANVTNPFKQEALKLASRLSPAAKAIGAVNTLRRGPRGWEGHNTDAGGFLAALAQQGFRPRGKRALILGAGGSARALAWALGQSQAASVIVLARRPAQARACAQLAGRAGKPSALSPQNIAAWSAQADLLVNTLPGNELGRAMARHLAKNQALAMDISYVPAKTAFLSIANKKNWKIVNGMGMLLHQGALAFQLWSRKKPNLSQMQGSLRNI